MFAAWWAGSPRKEARSHRCRRDWANTGRAARLPDTGPGVCALGCRAAGRLQRQLRARHPRVRRRQLLRVPAGDLGGDRRRRPAGADADRLPLATRDQPAADAGGDRWAGGGARPGHRAGAERSAALALVWPADGSAERVREAGADHLRRGVALRERDVRAQLRARVRAVRPHGRRRRRPRPAGA